MFQDLAELSIANEIRKKQQIIREQRRLSLSAKLRNYDQRQTYGVGSVRKRPNTVGLMQTRLGMRTLSVAANMRNLQQS